MERTEPMLPRIWRYTRSNGLGAVALVVALTMTPFPSHAGHLVVRTSDIVNGAVTRAKVRDGAVTAAKLNDGAVTKPKIRDGAVGASKLASINRRIGRVEQVPTGAHAIATAHCHEGEVVISGGAAFDGIPDNSFIVASFRPVNENSWFAKGKNDGPTRNFNVSAYCLAP